MFRADTACFSEKPISVHPQEWVFFMQPPKRGVPLVPFPRTFLFMSAPILSWGEGTAGPALSSLSRMSSQIQDIPSPTAEERVER